MPCPAPRAVCSLLATAALLLNAVPLAGQCPGYTYPPRPGGSSGGGVTPPGPGVTPGPTSPGPAGPATPARPAAPRPAGPGDVVGPTTGGPRGPAGPVSGPTTGGSGPAAPQPGAAKPAGGPTTGPRGPAGPAAPAAAPGRPANRTPMVLTHGPTGDRMLRIDWDHPVHVPPAPTTGTHTQVPEPTTLSAAELLRRIAGDDTRPMLVLRECPNCKGSDLALLRSDAPNERTLLLTSFFHCVRLPAEAGEPDHPFAPLFPDHGHLFLCQADGSGRVEFDGQQTQSALWQAMRGVLAESRAGQRFDAKAAADELLQLLAQVDRLDAAEADQLAVLDGELARTRPDKRRVQELQDRLQQIGSERAALLEQAARLRRPE